MRRPLLALLALFTALPAAAGDWQRFADTRNLEILTADEDGSPRETTIWIVVVDGNAYIRTGDSRWGANIVRNPDVVLRVGEQEIPARAHFEEEPALRRRVVEAFHAKYGWTDSLIGWFRPDHPKIMRLTYR